MTRQIYAVGTIAGCSLYVAYLTRKPYTGFIQYDNVQERKIGNYRGLSYTMHLHCRP